MLFNLFVRPAKNSVYDWQMEIARKLDLKFNIFINSKQLCDEEIVEKCREDYESGAELGLWLTPLEDMPNTMLWLLSEDDKRQAVKQSFERFCEAFGFYPEVCGQYILDASLLALIKEYCPEIKAAVAGCFEEGVKVFHGCNNSWYLFSEGMSWGPWYPSKGHSVRPAENEEDWSGVVAVPHLCRDLVFGYESRNDFFASHPANVQRGLANDGAVHEYDYNLIDQYRMQADFNSNEPYYQIHVGSGWLSHNHNVIDPDEITQGIYYETLKYVAELCKSGEARSLTFSEFADEYRRQKPIGEPTVGVGKDILMGSGKQYYWIYDTAYRALVDVFQGGSIGDLRPYAGKYDATTGVDAPNGRYLMNSYPYLIQSQYRTGYKNHYVDGSRTTLLVSHAGETLDLCEYNTRIERTENTESAQILTLAPVELSFDDGFKISLQTEYIFNKNGKIGIVRRIVSTSDDNAEVIFTEYVKGCYGFTEYPEDMKGITFYADGKAVKVYDYKDEKTVTAGGKSVGVNIPEITTEFTLGTDADTFSSEISDGHLFNPYYTMKLNFNAKGKKEVASWLQISKSKI